MTVKASTTQKKAKAVMRCLALTRAVRESPRGSRCGQYEADPALLAISIAEPTLPNVKNRQSFLPLFRSMPRAKASLSLMWTSEPQVVLHVSSS